MKNRSFDIRVKHGIYFDDISEADFGGSPRYPDQVEFINNIIKYGGKCEFFSKEKTGQIRISVKKSRAPWWVNKKFLELDGILPNELFKLECK